jgi:FkbM family methyltransferase
MNEYVEIIKNKTIISPKTILEIGSRDGDDAEYLRNVFGISKKNVWVVEPNPNQFKSIEIKYPDINLIKNPIFNEEKNITFYAVNTNDKILNGVSSLLNRKDNLYDKIETDKIQTRTMLGSELLKKINSEIDLCKIDVEGATYQIMESFDNLLSKIKSMHIECEHREVWLEQKLYDDVSYFLKERNFIQVYFQYCSGDTLQSDSIWVQKNFLK